MKRIQESESFGNQLNDCLSALKISVSWLDFVHLSTKLAQTNLITLRRQQEIHLKKFDQLQKEQSGKQNDPEKVIFNFSSHQLSSLQKKVLCRGLNFSLPPSKLDYSDHFLQFEVFYRSICSLPVFGADQTLVKTRVKDTALSSFHSFNPKSTPCPIPKAELDALKELSKVENLVIQKADKGNCVVLLDRPDYDAKMADILNDTSKFQLLSVAPGKELNHILAQERKLIKTLNILKKNKFDRNLYSKLAPSGSQPGRMYGLGKVHKPGCPMRPILSAIGTPSFKLAKFLVPILAPITTNDYTVKDSFTFAKDISGKDSDGLFMASLDVKSLFTNIPLNETIDICVENLFSSPGSKPEHLNKCELKSLLSGAVKDCSFIFNSQWYKQLDGVAMGSPLGPTLANAFLAHHEKSWLANCPSDFKPVLYKRYVDDIFLLFTSELHVKPFQDYMNTQHHCMEFTSECESNGSMAFLDLSICSSNGKFSTSVYRKPSFSGVYSSFLSFIPENFKYGLVHCLLFRSYNLCDSFVAFHKEVLYLKSILSRNGYPIAFIDSCISKFLNSVHKPIVPKAVSVARKSVCLVLPYTGMSSVFVRNRIVNLCKRYFPQVSCKVIFRPSVRVANLFSFKDRIPMSLRSCVCYQFQCNGCNAVYYGKSKRHYQTRVCEHLGISNLTGKRVSDPQVTAVSEHIESCNELSERPSLDSFSIISSASCDFYVKIKETLLVARDNPQLNRNVSSLPLKLF